MGRIAASPLLPPLRTGECLPDGMSPKWFEVCYKKDVDMTQILIHFGLRWPPPSLPYPAGQTGYPRHLPSVISEQDIPPILPGSCSPSWPPQLPAPRLLAARVVCSRSGHTCLTSSNLHWRRHSPLLIDRTRPAPAPIFLLLGPLALLSSWAESSCAASAAPLPVYFV